MFFFYDLQLTWSNLLDTIEADSCDLHQAHAPDLYTSAYRLAPYHRPFALADHVRVPFFQQDHVAWSCPLVDHAPIPFFLADHVQECAHVDRVHQHDVASYMIGCLDHCTRDNHMPMAMSTLLPSSGQRKDISNDLSYDAPPLLCAAAFHDHAETYSTAFET